MRASLAVGLTLLLAAARAPAQPPAGTDTLSPAAIADSMAVLDRLAAYLKDNPKDAAAHYRRGQIAYALEYRSRPVNAPRRLESMQLRSLAETSLRAALDLDPDNPRYLIAIGRFTKTGSGEAVPRTYFRKALESARALRDEGAAADALTHLHAAALDLGAMYWAHSERHDDFDGGFTSTEYENDGLGDRRPQPRDRASGAASEIGAYDTRFPPIDRAGVTGGHSSTAPATLFGAIEAADARLAPLGNQMRAAIDIAANNWYSLPRPESFYLNAEQYTREAYELMPGDSATFRQLAAIMLGRERWADLRALAQDHTVRRPADPWGWMALGLAHQRERASRLARPAFDTALARLDPAERARLDRFERVLSPRDSAVYVRASAAAQASIARIQWLIADPLWSEDEEDPRTEFLARLAYAELRFTDWAMQKKGADSPDGQLHVRYGPHDKRVGPFAVYAGGLMFDRCMRTGEFCRPMDLELYADLRNWRPALWDNIAAVRIDSMPAQLARFRAADSVDVLLASRVPAAALRGPNVSNASPVTRAWLYAWMSPDARECTLLADSAGDVQWRTRVPAGSYYLRIESGVPGGRVAARTASTMNIGGDTAAGFAMSGFGLSDLLLARSASAPASARRWSDFAITPLTGSIARGDSVSLIWELYELRPRNEAAEYEVTLEIARPQTIIGRLAARIVSGVTRSVGGSTGGSRLTMKFDRRVPYAATLVDHVVVAFGDTPAGTYTMTVSVKDKATGRATSRTTPLVIRE